MVLACGAPAACGGDLTASTVTGANDEDAGGGADGSLTDASPRATEASLDGAGPSGDGASPVDTDSRSDAVVDTGADARPWMDGARDAPPDVAHDAETSDVSVEGIVDSAADGIADSVADGVADGVADSVADGVADGVADSVADAIAVSSDCSGSQVGCQLGAGFGLCAKEACGGCTSQSDDWSCQAAFGSASTPYLCNAAGFCVPGNCHADADCQPTQICGGTTPNTCGGCTADIQCQSDPNYGFGTICDPLQGLCVTGPSGPCAPVSAGSPAYVVHPSAGDDTSTGSGVMVGGGTSASCAKDRFACDSAHRKRRLGTDADRHRVRNVHRSRRDPPSLDPAECRVYDRAVRSIDGGPERRRRIRSILPQFEYSGISVRPHSISSASRPLPLTVGCQPAG